MGNCLITWMMSPQLPLPRDFSPCDRTLPPPVVDPKPRPLSAQGVQQRARRRPPTRKWDGASVKRRETQGEIESRRPCGEEELKEVQGDRWPGEKMREEGERQGEGQREEDGRRRFHRKDSPPPSTRKRRGTSRRVCGEEDTAERNPEGRGFTRYDPACGIRYHRSGGGQERGKVRESGEDHLPRDLRKTES
ncbi:hypothetical protein NDU88_002472 [Pleurodeles waltl]|uniref:Uncharacterized protein n=1 Tax=Pleurodeles waltl TaxID=8319 RepID=A0AAV7M499_PLEWA|nr:hypothetical protein NDU88_002472 [Pleurodeles waltl]